MFKLGVFIAFMAAISTAPALADEMASNTTKGHVTDTKKMGVALGIGNPFPGLLGINGSYQILPDVRITAGYAEVEVTTAISFTGSGIEEKKVKAQTYELGGQYLFTDWAVRPSAGMHLGYFNVSGDGEFELNGFNKSAFHVYSNLGIDWVAQSGFQLAAGLNVALLNASGTGFYTNLGWFF